MKIFKNICLSLLWGFIIIIFVFSLSALGVPFTTQINNGYFHGSGYQFIATYGFSYSVKTLDHSNFYWFYPTSSYSGSSFVGNLLMVLLVAVPILLIFAIFVTLKLIKGVKRPYSIEYIDARKMMKKTTKHSHHAIKKSYKLMGKKQISEKEYNKIKKDWEIKLKQAQLIFDNEHNLYLKKYNIIK